MLYYRDITEYEEDFVDRHYDSKLCELLADGFTKEEAEVLALEEIGDMWRSECMQY